MNNLIVIFLMVVSIIAIIGGFYSLKKSKTATEFFLLNGNLKLSSFISTMVASNLSLGNMIFVCAIWGYFFGISGAFWVAVTIILLIFGYLIFGKYFKSYIEDRSNNGSLHEFISNLYIEKGNINYKRLRYFSSLVTIITLLLAIILELHIASTLFVQVFETSLESTFLVLVSIIAAYAILGGFRTVVHTDILQSVLLIVAIIAGFYFYFNFESAGITSHSFRTIFSGAGWANALGISFLGFAWLLATMDTWQRNSASRSLDISFKGVSWAGGIMVVFVILFALFGMYVKDAIAPIAQENGLATSGGFYPFNDLFAISNLASEQFLQVSLAALFVGLIMAAASTADTFFVVMSHSFTTDILISKTNKSLGQIDEKQNLLFGSVGRIVVISSTFIIMIVWFLLSKFNLLNSPLDLFYIAYSVQYALLPALIFGIFFKRKHTSTAILSIISGIISTLFIGFYFSPKSAAGISTEYLALRPDQWMGLLPFTTFVISGLFYIIINFIKSK